MMDAGSMAVFSLACLVLYKLASRFSKDVDKATIEVSDFTVVIKGLPETTPIDVSRQPAGPEGGPDSTKVMLAWDYSPCSYSCACVPSVAARNHRQFPDPVC
jgi:hypothetical protein